jgi:CheY-like chemotaxis protein
MKKILVVDDAAMIRELLTELLEDRGYTVLAAEDGEQALGLIANEPVDLCFIDIFLPKKGGLQVMGELAKMESPPRIIAISGGESFSPDSVLELASIFRVEESFTKPLDADRVLDAVERILNSSAA